MSEVTVTVETPENPVGIAEVSDISTPSEVPMHATPVTERVASEVAEVAEEGDEIIQAQLDEVEQWRTNLTDQVNNQGMALVAMGEQLSKMSGVLATLLTLAQPNLPSEEEVAPREPELEVVENPPEAVEPEAQPEPEAPPPRTRGRQWM